MKWISLFLFGSVGLGTLLYGINWGAEKYSFFLDGVQTEGVVIDFKRFNLIRSNSRSSEKTFLPVVEFVAITNKKAYVIEGKNAVSKSKYPINSSVKIIYNKNNPYDAEILDFTRFWIGPAIFTLLGFIFLIFGIGGFFVFSNSKKSSPTNNKGFGRNSSFQHKKNNKTWQCDKLSSLDKEYADSWLSMAETLGIEVIAPFELIENNEKYVYAACIKNFGAEDYTNGVLTRIADTPQYNRGEMWRVAGESGFQVFDEIIANLPLTSGSAKSSLNMFRWYGVAEEKPDWHTEDEYDSLWDY